MGWDAVLMDHRSSQVDRAEWRCALSPVPGDRGSREQYVRKARAFLEAFERLPQSRAFPLEDVPPVGFDRVVVGSDEVWNLRHPWYGGRELFYGRGLDRPISYAASFGNQDAEGGLPDHYAQWLRGFSSIAVRDQNSRRIVTQMLEEEPEIVLDPCLQFGSVMPLGESQIEQPYAAVYGHSFPRWFGQLFRDWARERGLTLVSIGYRNEWADRQWIEAGPLDYPSFIAGAAAVATNFFHGCVFSLLTERPFICAPSDYRNNKVRDLLNLLRAPERLLAPDQQPNLDRLLSLPAGAQTYDEIARLRRVSTEYLDHAIG